MEYKTIAGGEKDYPVGSRSYVDEGWEGLRLSGFAPESGPVLVFEGSRSPDMETI